MDSNETSPNVYEGDEESDLKYEESACDTRDLSYHDIATKLLNDNLLLTALELHVELVEAGKELPKLRIFFSNPGNFEQHTIAKPDVCSPSIPRSLSQATLDSLDLTRFSEDGERGVDERVAVLEFELRKAKETICALRANLTVATESETPTPEGVAVKPFGSEPVKPHEQRALNFLINEYLLLHGYKLTSITFADENENQDFEDWDDVGLNIPKPAELLQLYRDYMRQTGHSKPPQVDAGCQTENMEEPEEDISNATEKGVQSLDLTAIGKLRDELCALQEQNESLEREKQNLQDKLWSIEQMNNDVARSEDCIKGTTKTSKESFHRDEEDGDGWTAVAPMDLRDLQQTTTEEDQISADIDWASVTMSTPDPVKVPRSDSQSGSGSGSACGASDTRGLTVEDEDHISAESEWTSVGSSQSVPQARAKNLQSSVNLDLSYHEFERPMSAALCKEVLSVCTVNTQQLPECHQHLSEALSKVGELSGPTDGLTDKLVNILSKTLIKLLPCVILNKREEVIPLLVALVRLHSDCKERDRLLHQLFNLKKRPDEEERRLILMGLINVAQGMEAGLVENEVLPQCWEQINHKYVERRLLVAEACGVLAPFVTSAMRSSLMLSILQQMLSEDREDVVRAAVVRSAALVAAMSPVCDKFVQCEDLVIACLTDPSPTVIHCVSQTLLPVVAQWALSTNCLQSSLFMKLLSQLLFHVQAKQLESPRSPSMVLNSANQTSQAALSIISVMTAALPFLVLCVANVEPVTAKISPDLLAPQPRVGFSELCRGLSNPVVFHSGGSTVGQIIAAFDAFLIDLDTSCYWPELCWISDKMLPVLIDTLNHVTVSQDDLLCALVSFFRYLCAGFGPIVVSKLIKPAFKKKLEEIEKTLVELSGSSSEKSSWPSLSILAVYLGGILSTGQSENDMEDLRNTLRKFLMALPLCLTNTPGRFGSPIDALQATVSVLCSANRDSVNEAVLATLWEGVVSQRAAVRCAAASLFSAVIGAIPEALISARVAPALVTLASDPDVSVKTAAVPTFGKLIISTTTKEVKEKICFQLQSVLSDPVTRNSHALMLQLVTTLGHVVSSCDAQFREDVIMPQLAGLAAYASQLQNLTRRLDLAVALTEAFSAAVYIPLPASVLSSAMLPGLRYLEQISQQLQPVHRETILAMIQEVESRSGVLTKQQEERRSSRGLATANVNQGVEDMRQRMSKMFQPKNLGNQPGLPSLFRKK